MGPNFWLALKKMATNYKKIYLDFLKKHIKVERPLKVVFDASNGPAGIFVKDLWKGTPIEAILIHDDIDPDFKAHAPNPLLPGASDSCAKAILKHKADLGVIFDADGDRAFFLDNKGVMIPACFVTSLLFKESKPPFVADELVYQSLAMLKLFPEKDLIPSRIGAYFIKEKMKTEGAGAGAEYSGHYYFKDFFGADSGLFAAIKVIQALSEISESVSTWRAQFGEHKILTTEIHTDGKDMKTIYTEVEKKYKPLARRVDTRDGFTFVFDTYWINVRSSNTEPIMRIVSGGDIRMRKTVKEIQKIVA